jgi:phosphoglycolate phosphatase
MNSKPIAIIFDLDGTLLNTLSDLANSVNRVLASHNFPVHATEAYRFFVGDGARMLIKRALPENQREEKNIEKCLDEFKKEYQQNWHNETILYPGIAEMLNALTAYDLKLAILSNKPHTFTLKCVHHFLSKWNFDVIVGQQESIPQKPDPAGALLIARQLNIEPASFLYVGDSAVDMKTACASAMFPMGVLWGFRPAEELKTNGAAALLSEPLEIIQYL